MIWVLTDIEGYNTCEECGAVVYVKGEGLPIHQRWHKRYDGHLRTLYGAVADLVPDE